MNKIITLLDYYGYEYKITERPYPGIMMEFHVKHYYFNEIYYGITGKLKDDCPPDKSFNPKQNYCNPRLAYEHTYKLSEIVHLDKEYTKFTKLTSCIINYGDGVSGRYFRLDENTVKVEYSVSTGYYHMIIFLAKHNMEEDYETVELLLEEFCKTHKKQNVSL